MPDSSVTWLQRPRPPAYSDADALNDIVVLLTTIADTDEAILGDIAAIVARTGRPMVPVRHLDATVTDTPSGRPVARIDADGASVTVRQEPAGSGLIVEIAGASGASAGRDTTVTLDGRCLHRPCPPGGHVA